MAKILIVDDEPDIIRLVSRIMQGQGHEVVTAANGVTALKVTREELPDLVIIDLDLPQLNGFEVCKQIKSGEATGHIPVVMMTAAYVSLADAKRASSVGADEYIFRPFMSELLVENIERLLRRVAQ